MSSSCVDVRATLRDCFLIATHDDDDDDDEEEEDVLLDDDASLTTVNVGLLASAAADRFDDTR